MDLPSPRKIHEQPTPRLGGLAVAAATLAATFAFGALEPGHQAVALGAAAVYAAGAWEDWRGLSAWARLATHLGAAAFVCGCGVRLFGEPESAVLPASAFLGSTLWLAGSANTFNMIDGIDGLAASLGAVSAFLLMPLLGWMDPVPAAALAGACLGFLPYNWSRARCFLGDGGATFIGFWLAGLALLASRRSPAAAGAMLAIPWLDLAYTTISRVRRGDIRTMREWILFAGKDHLHHKLLERGFSPPGAVAALAAAQAALGLLALALAF